jgi:hypothetical protein
MNSNPQGPPPENHLVWAILTTVMCCMPLGIIAIIKSNKVAQLWYQGRHAEAQKAADDAKKFSIWSAASIGVIVLLYLIVIFIIFIVQIAANS